MKYLIQLTCDIITTTFTFSKVYSRNVLLSSAMVCHITYMSHYTLRTPANLFSLQPHIFMLFQMLFQLVYAASDQ
jgi:hypothetical protein